MTPASQELEPPGNPAGFIAVSERILPDGLKYIDSGVVNNVRLDCCIQRIETDDHGLIDVWRANWQDLAEFQVYPVIDPTHAAG